MSRRRSAFFARIRAARPLARVGLLVAVEYDATGAFGCCTRAAGLADADYATPDVAREKLADFFDLIGGTRSGFFVTALAGALGMRRRQHEALLVYETFLASTGEAYQDPSLLRQRVATRSSRLSGDLRSGPLSSLVMILDVSPAGFG